jgi:hypothetical protein
MSDYDSHYSRRLSLRNGAVGERSKSSESSERAIIAALSTPNKFLLQFFYFFIFSTPEIIIYVTSE